jgi:hypothetical protein
LVMQVVSLLRLTSRAAAAVYSDRSEIDPVAAHEEVPSIVAGRVRAPVRSGFQIRPETSLETRPTSDPKAGVVDRSPKGRMASRGEGRDKNRHRDLNAAK